MTLMIDTIGANAGNIPTATPKVAGYKTGLGDVPWTDADWTRFPHSGHIGIRQLMTPYDPFNADVIDVEKGACTAQDAARWAHDRYTERRWISCIYVDAADVAATVQTVLATGVPAAYITLWVADWQLNEQQAQQMIGTHVQGCEVVAVQWASPTSNPDTVVPGGTGTLKQLNLDLSVTRDDWFAYRPPTPPPTPAPTPLSGIVVTDNGGFVTRLVHSTDGGKTWS